MRTLKTLNALGLATLAVCALFLACCASVTALAQPTITNGPRTQFAWAGKRVALSATVTGKAPFQFQWQLNGTNLIGSTNMMLAFPQVQLTNNGAYRLVATDSTASATSQVAQVMVRSWPQPTGPRIPELARLDTNMQSILLTYAIPGGSLAVVKDGRLVFTSGYGWADVENDEPFQPDSRCLIASLSKTITAAAVMKLVEDGKVSLDTGVFSLLNLQPPHYAGAVFDSRWTNITVRHLLSHTAGWNSSSARNPLGGTEFEPEFWPDWAAQDLGLSGPATPTDIVRWMLGKPLQADPGTHYAYSTFGFVVAGRVIEKITGEPYEMAVGQLLAEVGITRIQLGPDSRAERATGEVLHYLNPSATASIWGIGSWAEPKPFDFDLPYAYPVTLFDAGGGLIACAMDYARFVAAIDGLPTFPDVLSTNSVKTMAGGSLGWDSVTSVNPTTGIWNKYGAWLGCNSHSTKWLNGVIFVFVLNSCAVDASGNNWVDTDLYNLLTLSMASVSWPTNDLFAATLSYEAWRAKYFSTSELADPTVSGDDADPVGDGIPNLLAYASGLDPRVPNEPPKLVASVSVSNGVASLVVSFRRLLLTYELDYNLESSADFSTWSPVTGQVDEPSLNADGTVTTSVHAGSPADSSARFFRLRVSRK
ncbi:MAG: serine hydrolase [Verrucomicrobiota bacterium]